MKKLMLTLAVFAFVSFSLSAQVSSEKNDVKSKTVEQQKLEQQKLAKQRVERERLAKEQVAKPQANNPNAPVASFKKLVHDYGTIEQYADGNCEFEFTNTGKEPLILSNVRSS